MNRNINNSVTINMDPRESSAFDNANNTDRNYYKKGNIESENSATLNKFNKTSKNENRTALYPSYALQDENDQQDMTNRDHNSSNSLYAKDLKQQDENSMHSSSRLSSSTRSRPGSVTKNVPFRERSSSSFSVPGRSPRPNSSKNHSRRSLKMPHASSEYEEYEEGLSELLGTVRQYAKEIREIYAPIKKDEEERIRKKEERNARRKSKDLNKSPSLKPEKSPVHHEVRVEIHKTNNQINENTLEEGRRHLRHETLSHSKSHEPAPANHVASLHVEEERLPSTWPRGQQRPRSRERFSSDATLSIQNPYKSSSPTYMRRPQISADWCAASSVQHEKEMLNKAFQRIQKPSDDPLIGTFNKSRPASQIHEQMVNSRQGVIEVARQHKQARQAALPSISIISPASEYRNRSWNSPGGILPSAPPEYESSYLPPQPSAPPLYEESYNETTQMISGDNAVHRSTERAVDNKFSKKDGFRRRKSVDQKLVQDHTVLEKY